MKTNEAEYWEQFFIDWEEICEHQHTLQAEIEILEERKRKLLIDSLANVSTYDVGVMRNCLKRGNFPYLD